MTTVYQTLDRIASNTPSLYVDRTSGEITNSNARTTAQVFVDQNVRHIVTRRMRWSSVKDFVEQSLTALVARINASRPTSESTQQAIIDTVTEVQTCLNRRVRWLDSDVFKGARTSLINSVAVVVLSAAVDAAS